MVSRAGWKGLESGSGRGQGGVRDEVLVAGGGEGVAAFGENERWGGHVRA